MSTELGEKLQAAILEKENDINSFTWKLSKTKDQLGIKQKEIKLINATEDQLKTFNSHCYSMLYNKSKEHPGRVVLLKEIQKQRIKCGIELFLRYSESLGTSRIAILDSLRFAISNNNVETSDLKHMTLSEFVNTPVEYRSLPIETVIDGCLDRLGKYDRRHITLSFILKQGLWFSEKDMQEITERNEDGSLKSPVSVVIERLNLPSFVSITLNPKGLNYTQFRAIITLKSKKYSEMTTDQLKVLRSRILYALEDEVKRHAEFWIQKEKEIEKVAKHKGIVLETKM